MGRSHCSERHEHQADDAFGKIVEVLHAEDELAVVVEIFFMIFKLLQDLV